MEEIWTEQGLKKAVKVQKNQWEDLIKDKCKNSWAQQKVDGDLNFVACSCVGLSNLSQKLLFTQVQTWEGRDS